MKPTRASRHIVQNEDLLFEISSPGKKGYQLPELDVPAAKLAATRKEIPDFPELSELEVIRHYTRLSTWNYGVDTGIYPLGSCTMKYNARVNEHVTRIEGLGDGHPLQPEALSGGALRIMQLLSQYLLEITGMDAITLQPAAGAQGELTGILLVREALRARGDARKKVLIPDSAHGTNPATAAIAGYQVENLKSNATGTVDMASLERQMTGEVAALMLTNPNTLGIFEEDIHRIADLVHERGGMLYMDGANMNALVGRSRPGDFGVDVMHLNLHKTFSTPHGGGGPGAGPVAVKRELEPFLPIPVLTTRDGKPTLEYDRPRSIGRVRAFYGNFGMFTRALAYIMANGCDGLLQTTEDAVLNANYIRKKLEGSYALPYPTPSMHEVIFSDALQAPKGVHTGDIAKRLIDYGFHPYTVSFPLVVRGALMIEPTESANLPELDEFIAAMKAIAEEAQTEPATVTNAPHTTKISRLDEVAAARSPVLRWKK
ncbi:MAG TPA: aminomethyl-transferring glycine dehydrogenase subunit GcvPB [Terriglobales bacterium]|nr:aminomethyl-transferring glycine dehydrogenase subunit GcvPB [Terriglobales bacterium]